MYFAMVISILYQQTMESNGRPDGQVAAWQFQSLMDIVSLLQSPNSGMSILYFRELIPQFQDVMVGLFWVCRIG